MDASIAARLRGIVGGAVPRVEAGTAARPAAPAGGWLSDAGVARAAALLGGEVRTGADGPVVTVDRRYGPWAHHGRWRVGDIVETLQGAADALETLGRAWPRSRIQNRGAPSRLPALLFLDLETTGLAGGAGTRAFLVGCARLDGEGIATRQFLMAGDEHEKALLAEVASWAMEAPSLVTFNGRTFDLPLIETRFLFHRLPFPLEDLPHVDMLHPARRLWKQPGSAPGPAPDEDRCSLTMLERRLAHLHRAGDVAGFEIPSRYFQFLRNGDARPLESVLEHNRLDLLSTAMVMARTLSLVQRGPAVALDPRECLGLARVYDRAGALDSAEASYVRTIHLAARLGGEPELQADALRRLAWCRRRTARPAEAADAWAALAALPRCPAALRREAREALAIHHEHRSRDLAAAHALVTGLLGEELTVTRRDAVEYRLRRLERKLAGLPERCLPLPLG